MSENVRNGLKMSDNVRHSLNMSENDENDVFEDENDMFDPNSDMSEMFENGLNMSEHVGNSQTMSDNVRQSLKMSDIVGSKMSENVRQSLNMSDNVGGKMSENKKGERGKRVGEDERIMTANGVKNFDEFRSWIKLSYARRNKEGSSDTLELRREELEAHIRKNVVGDNLKRFIRQNKDIVGVNVYNLFYKSEFVRLPHTEPSEGAARSYEWDIKK